jgi:predicted Zn-dependent peptidase
VRRNAKPAHRVALALVVRAGSVNERDDARGVAHILEHLAFNATETFTKHALVNFLEAAGLPFGACQNAHTSADETVYELLLPVDGPEHELLSQALSVLAEFASKIRCAPEDLEAERGAVLEEWRATQDARGRDAEAYWRLLHRGTLYEHRLPIGLETVIRSVNADTVRSFYADWYRPRNMAVVAVGDWGDRENTAIVDAIGSAFRGVEPLSPDPGPPKPNIAFVPHDTPRVLCVTDRELQGTEVSVSFSRAQMPRGTPRELHAMMVHSVFIEVLNSRLFRVARAQTPPFYSASADLEDMCASMALFVVGATAPVGGALPALEALLIELARVRLHGFTAREVAAARARIDKDLETNFIEKDQAHSELVRDEYVRNFTVGEAVLDAEFEARLMRTQLKSITPQEAADCAQRFRGSHSCIIKVTSGSTDKRPPAEAELLAVLARVDAREAAEAILPLDVADVPSSLMPAPPTVTPEAKIISRRIWSAWDVKELSLSNGLRVAIKRTPWLDDQVLLSAYAHGGLSQLPNGKGYWSASASTMLASEVGICGHAPEVLDDILSGKRAGITPTIAAFKRGISGESSPADMDSALCLCHLLFVTEPQAKPHQLRAAYDMARERMRATKRDALSRFAQAVKDTVYGNKCWLTQPMTETQLTAFAPQDALRYFADAFSNPAEWTLTLVGAVPEHDVLEPLIEQYLATIPAREHPVPMSPADVRALPWAFPAGPVRRTVKAYMAAPQAQVHVAVPLRMVTRSSPNAHEQAGFAHEDSLWLRLACSMLETRLLGVLRFRSGKVYSLSVSPFFGMEAPSSTPPFRGDCAVVLSCDPAAAWGIVDVIIAEIGAMQRDGPTQEEVDTAAEVERRTQEVALEQNGTWLDRIQAGYQVRPRMLFSQLGVVTGG